MASWTLVCFYETYRLFEDGIYNDNGAAFEAVAAFGYENYGTDLTQKTFDEAATVLKMSRSTKIEEEIRYDYKGATDIKTFNIDLDVNTNIIFAPSTGAGYGKEGYGKAPHGSSTEVIEEMLKVRVVQAMIERVDFFERQRVYKSSSIDARFEIMAYGENVEISPNIPTFIKQ